MKLEEKWSFSIGSSKILFLWKVVGHFCNFQVFLPTNALKRSAVDDDRPLFATLYGVWIHSETLKWHEKNIQSNARYRKVLTTQLNHLASSAKWLCVRLQTKWLLVRAPLQSLKLQISHLDIQATTEFGFTLKHVRNMLRTYSILENLVIRCF